MRIAHIASQFVSPPHEEKAAPQANHTSVQLHNKMEKRTSLPPLETGTSTTTSASSSQSASASNSSSASQASSTSDLVSTSSASVSSVMPVMTSASITSSTGMPTIPTTSSSSTSTSYTFHAAVPTNETANPFIIRENLPLNSVFIVLAGVLGLLGLGVFLTWIIVWWNSRRRAKTEKEVQYYNPFHYESGSNGSAVHLLGGSSQSSFMEKSSSSIHSKFSEPVSLGMDTTTPGRSYREMSTNLSRRGSMTISPVMEMMRSSASNLDLPLFNPAPEAPMSMSMPAPSTPTETSEPPAKKSRPPSQLLDDMLTAIEFSSHYPEALSRSP